ncbi:MAG: hypothetical protein M3P52_11160, partial [Actinomycetota bacterium]|nr:hypothetical protein [Actinomycetota bacterium]
MAAVVAAAVVAAVAAVVVAAVIAAVAAVVTAGASIRVVVNGVARSWRTCAPRVVGVFCFV